MNPTIRRSIGWLVSLLLLGWLVHTFEWNPGLRALVLDHGFVAVLTALGGVAFVLCVTNAKRLPQWFVLIVVFICGAIAVNAGRLLPLFLLDPMVLLGLLGLPVAVVLWVVSTWNRVPPLRFWRHRSRTDAQSRAQTPAPFRPRPNGQPPTSDSQSPSSDAQPMTLPFSGRS